MSLKPPPRDAHGVVVPHDHDEIEASDRIIRPISPEHIVADIKAKSGRRISSMAFRPSSRGNRGMSVDIERSILDAGLHAASFVSKPPFVGSVWFFAGLIRSESFLVGFDPVPDNPHHGEVWGTFSSGRQKRLQLAAAWFVAIADTDLTSASPADERT